MRAGRLVGAALAVTAGLALALVPAAPASAHPLGNFTSNTADRLEVVAGGMRVLHVLDLAEVPSLQLSQASRGVDTNGDGRLDDAELTRYSQRLCATVAPQLQLTVDGSPGRLELVSATGQARPGQAGLQTSRLECTFTSPTRPRSTFSYVDGASQQRTGWAEVTAVSVCGRLTGSTVPVDSPSSLLSSYPQNLLTSPLAINSATSGIEAGGPCLDQVGGDSTGRIDAAQPRGVDRLTNAFTNFVSQPDLTLGFVLGAVLLSLAFGALHALAPGHGKTVVAAYLVGQRGNRRQALWLGAAVTFAHTASVLALGAVLSLTALASPGRVVPYAEVLSGVLLALVGAYLLRSAVIGLRHAVDHRHEHGVHEHAGHEQGGHEQGGHEHEAHDHEAHQHPHDHPHEHDHPHSLRTADEQAGAVKVRTGTAVHSHGGRAHSHAPLDDRPLGWRSLATMGVAGGLVPSPSALVVLLGATALGRAWFGVVLVLCYGIGMAMTLTAAGLVLLRTQAVLARRGWGLGQGSRAARLLPTVTAGVVVVVGMVLVIRGYLTSRNL